MLRTTTFTILTLALSSAFASASAQTQFEVIHLQPKAQTKTLQLTMTGSADSDWNCLDIDIAGMPLAAITPNDQHGVTEREREVLRITKELIPQTVLASTGSIGSLFELGELVAVEFDIFPMDPVPKPGDADHLGVVGLLMGVDALGEPFEVGRMFCYSQQDYAARLASLAAMMDGVFPEKFRVWLGRVAFAGSEGNRSSWIQGVGNKVHGGCKANGTFRLSGSDHVISGTIGYADISIRGEGHDLEELAVEPPEVAPRAPSDPSLYLLTAMSAGNYYTGDLTIERGPDGELVDENGDLVGGVVYATGDIFVLGEDMHGTVTLVSESGIYITGNNSTLDCATDDLLCYSFGNPGGAKEHSVLLAGDGNRTTGSLLAPDGGVGIEGDGNVAFGQLVGQRLRISGNSNVVDDGTF